MRYAFLLFLFLVFFSSPSHAEKSFLEGFFPWIFGDFIERQAKPEETLVAPFSYKPGTEPKELKGLPQNAAPLHLPHRGEENIAKWVGSNISRTLSYSGNDYLKERTAIQEFFTKEGYDGYLSFLKDSNLGQSLAAERFRMSAFNKETPLLLNSGVLEERYRWLYEVPVMITLLDKNIENYKEVQNPFNREYTITIQVGRTEEGGGDDGLLVERWSAKPVKTNVGKKK